MWRVDATLRDIAKRVNRSVTTVSRALHGYDDVSAETKALVARAAEEMGYIPNTAAQRLQRQKAHIVGLILSPAEPSLSDPTFGDILASIADEIAKSEYDLLISVAQDGSQVLDSYRKKVSGRSIDTVLVVRTKCDDSRIHYLLAQRIPFVSNGRVANNYEFPFVDTDYSLGMRELVRHLAELGHERIGFVSGSPLYMFASLQQEGYWQGQATAGLSGAADMVVISDLTQRGGYQGAQLLLSQNSPPTAILASNDLMALGVMSAIQDHGLEVGRDVAVAGFDGIALAETSHPTLTTVKQPSQQIGRALGRMLLATAEGRPISEPRVVVKPSLVIRQSTNMDLWL